MMRSFLVLLLAALLPQAGAAPVRAAAADGPVVFYLEFDDADPLHGVAPRNGKAVIGVQRDGRPEIFEGDCLPPEELERAGGLKGWDEAPPDTRFILSCPLGDGIGQGGHFFYADAISTGERRLIESESCKSTLPLGKPPFLLQLLGHQYLCWEDWSDVDDPRARLLRLLEERRDER